MGGGGRPGYSLFLLAFCWKREIFFMVYVSSMRVRIVPSNFPWFGCCESCVVLILLCAIYMHFLGGVI